MSKENYFKAQPELLARLLILTAFLLSFIQGTYAEDALAFSGIAFTSEKSIARVSLPYSFRSIGDLESPNEFHRKLNAPANGIKLKNGKIIMQATAMGHLIASKN